MSILPSAALRDRWCLTCRSLLWVIAPLLLLPTLLLSSCSLPQVKAEDRLFLNLSLEYLGSYQLPKQDFQGTKLGGLSGLTYDRQRNRFYAISDDRSNFAPARFYTLKLALNPTDNPETSGIRTVEIESVTVLKAENGEPFPADTIDLEGIALSPSQSLFLSSEGVADRGIAPFVDEFELATGSWRGRLPIADRYLPRSSEGKPTGVQNNLGFESLTLNASSYGTSQLEPFRLFTATESALQQDLPQEHGSDSVPNSSPPVRFLHYLVGEDQSLLIAEHLYLLDPAVEGTQNHGLSELLVLDQAGHLLSLERSFGLTGFSGKIFQLVIGDATDTSRIPAFAGNTEGITPIHKRLVLDLTDLGIPLDNYEGMTLGPQLPDGSQSLLLISDDNFNELQTTELLLFRLRQR